MIPWLRDLVVGLLWDEAKGQRYVAAFLVLLGSLMQSGGVVPGTDSVVPGFAALTPYGDLVKALGVFVAAGTAPRKA